MQAAIAFVGSCMSDYACAIGMDTAQGRPGDALEYTAGSGGAAFLLGPADKSVAVVEGTYSFVTDTPDFWRRSNAKSARSRRILETTAGQRYWQKKEDDKLVRNSNHMLMWSLRSVVTVISNGFLSRRIVSSIEVVRGSRE